AAMSGLVDAERQATDHGDARACELSPDPLGGGEAVDARLARSDDRDRFDVGALDRAAHVENRRRVGDVTEADRIPLVARTQQIDAEVLGTRDLAVDVAPSGETTDRADERRRCSGFA